MKMIVVLACSLIVIFAAGCGPSSEELAITMVAQTDVAATQTRAAVPTDTPTPTVVPLTPTLSVTAEEYYKQAQSYSVQGDDEKAIEFYTLAIETDPLLAQAYINRGAIYAQYHEADKALIDFNKGLELDPENGWGYINRASLFGSPDLQDYEKAFEDFDKAFSLFEDEELPISFYLNRGQTYESIGEDNLALDDYNAALKIDKENEITRFIRGQLYSSLEETEKAIVDYWLALYYEVPESFEEAIWSKFETMGILSDVLHSQELFTEASSFEKEGNYEQAIDLYTEAIELLPAYYFAYSRRGTNYRDIGEYRKALEDLTRAIELNPLDGENYFFRGLVYSDLNDRENASAEFERALEVGLPASQEAEAKELLEQLRSAPEGVCNLATVDAIPEADIPTFFIEFYGPSEAPVVIAIYDFKGSEEDEGSVTVTTIPENGVLSGNITYDINNNEDYPENYQILVNLPEHFDIPECMNKVIRSWP